MPLLANKQYILLLIQSFLYDEKWKDLDYIITKEELLTIQKEVQAVTIHHDVINYLLSIIRETRTNPLISLGASPRATLALIRSSQAFAYIKGRDFVIPDDVRKMAIPVLAHRLVLSADAKLTKQTSANIIKTSLAHLKMPTL